tara:strand:- start:1942 stop:2568 length:627 start_codon:yes stop_codon:yes gene_type:complete
MEEQNPVHINIYKENKESVDSSSNKAEAYIILANEELNNKNRELIQQLADLTYEKEQLEEDNEKMEKSTTYQRGLLHNLSELNKLEVEVSKNEKELNKNLMEENKFLKQRIKDIEYNAKLFTGLVFIVLLIQSSIQLISFVSLISIILSSISIFILGKFDKSLIFSLNSLEKFEKKRDAITDYIKAKSGEIKKITSSSDFLGDFIDSM